MRILLASTRAGHGAARMGSFAKLLRAHGHQVEWSLPDEGPAGAKASWRQSLALGKQLLSARPDVALVRLSPGAVGLISALSIARVPIVLDVDDTPRAATPGDLPPEGERASLMIAVRAAHRVLAESPSSADRARALGARHVVELAPRALPALLPGGRDDAKRALDLPLKTRWIAHVGPLSDEAQLEAIADAHRRLPGVGLLIVASGPRESFAHAMTMAARPSSPVTVIGPEATEVATWAADAVIWLGDARSEHATDPLLLGRRAIVREDLGLYAPARRATFVAPPVLEAMSRALGAESELGPIPRAEVLAARERASPIAQLEAALTCA